MGSAAEQERQEEERRREALKIQFEHLKHLTTLGGATALAELAIYQAVELDLKDLGLSLFALAVCVGGSLWQMRSAAEDMQSGKSLGSAWSGPAPFSGFYLAGLAMFALTAAGVSFWVAWALLMLWAANLIAGPGYLRKVVRWMRSG